VVASIISTYSVLICPAFESNKTVRVRDFMDALVSSQVSCVPVTTASSLVYSSNDITYFICSPDPREIRSMQEPFEHDESAAETMNC